MTPILNFSLSGSESKSSTNGKTNIKNLKKLLNSSTVETECPVLIEKKVCSNPDLDLFHIQQQDLDPVLL
jgi:hypothetical protein